MKAAMSNVNRRNALWITMVQAGLLGVVAGLCGYLLLSSILQAPVRAEAQGPPPVQGQPPGPGGFQGPPPFGPGGLGGERPLVAKFDKNGDRRLDTTERKAARESLAAEPARGGFGRRGGGPGGFGRGGMAPGSPGLKMAPADVKSYPASTPLYDLGALRTIFLQFENADWEQELAAFNNTDVEVPAIATVDGKAYRNVGVHFRGASSFMMVPEGSKRSLNLTFDFVDEKQMLYNYRTLNLLNANGDPTFVRAVLYSEIARQYIPAPRANYIRVVINGESWGVYVNAQQFNTDFTRDYYKTTRGARWKVPGNPGGRGGIEDVVVRKRLALYQRGAVAEGAGCEVDALGPDRTGRRGCFAQRSDAGPRCRSKGRTARRCRRRGESPLRAPQTANAPAPRQGLPSEAPEACPVHGGQRTGTRRRK